MPAPDIKVLGNGMIVMVQPMPEARAYAAQLFVRGGSAYETPQTEGAFHLIEHLAFLTGPGTYSHEAESSGSWMNATTFREFTRYVVSGPAAGWEKGLRSLVSLALRTGVPDAQFDREKRVVLEEIALQDLDPDTSADRAVWAAAFPGSGWGHRTSGGARGVQGLSADSLEQIRQQHYTGTNMVLVVTGNVSPERVHAECVPLGKLPQGNRMVLPPLPRPEATRITADAPVGGARIGIGFSAGGIRADDYSATLLAAEVLAGKHGLLANQGLNARVFFGPSEAGSLLTIVVSGPEDHLDLERLVLQTVRSAPDALEELVLSNARAVLRAQLLARARSPASHGFQLGVGALMREVQFASQELAHLEKVTYCEVVGALKRLDPTNAIVAVWRKP